MNENEIAKIVGAKRRRKRISEKQRQDIIERTREYRFKRKSTEKNASLEAVKR